MSTTTKLFNRCLTIPEYFSSAVTREAASPITPFSSKTPDSTLPLDPSPIEVMGRKVARPSFSRFKYSITSFAVFSSSVTTCWMLAPSAVSTAVSYSFEVENRSATTPQMPGKLSFFSITFFTGAEYPSYLSEICFKASAFELKPRYS